MKQNLQLPICIWKMGIPKRHMKKQEMEMKWKLETKTKNWKRWNWKQKWKWNRLGVVVLHNKICTFLAFALRNPRALFVSRLINYLLC